MGVTRTVQGVYGQPYAGMQAAIAAVQQQEAEEARFAQADAQRRRQQDDYFTIPPTRKTSL